MRALRTLLGAGVLHGALLYGVPVSLVHVLANRVPSVADAAITLAACLLLYGAASAALFLAAGLVAALVPAGQRAADPRARRLLAAGVFALGFLFWFRYFDIALTYDEVPPALRSLGGMLAWVAARGLLIALVVAAVARPVAAWLLAPLATGAGRLLAGVLVALAALHVVLPPWFAYAAARAATARPAPPPADLTARPTGVDVVLVGLDGAEWRVAAPLLAAGELPALARLMAAGVHAPLATLAGANSSTIWASIHTGQARAVHGIADFDRIRLPGMGPPGLFAVGGTYLDNFASDLEPWGLATRRAVDRLALAAVPLWEVLDAGGISFGLIDGFFYAYPAFVPRDPASFILAHGAATEYQRLRGRGAPPPDAPALAAWVQPPALLAAAAPYLERPEPEWQLEAALALLAARPRPRFVHVYVNEPDHIQHRFWKWYEPAYFPRVDPDELARTRDRIPAMYRRLDAFLDALLARLGPETVVIVCSDHGHAATILHPQLYSFHDHGPPGVLVMAGGPIAAGAALRDPHVLDLFPTVLHLLGLPVPEHAPGRVLVEALAPAFRTRTPIARLPSYQGLARRPAAGLDSAEHSAAEIEKLRAIGYIE